MESFVNVAIFFEVVKYTFDLISYWVNGPSQLYKDFHNILDQLLVLPFFLTKTKVGY